jgi:hypothetical protein
MQEKVYLTKGKLEAHPNTSLSAQSENKSSWPFLLTLPSWENFRKYSLIAFLL